MSCIVSFVMCNVMIVHCVVKSLGFSGYFVCFHVMYCVLCLAALGIVCDVMYCVVCGVLCVAMSCFVSSCHWAAPGS